jgi:arylsulfatase A-like enzyme
MKRTQPNILLLFTDQQRADTIAALGNRIIRTPALDRLAREGTAFTRCYTPSPVCVSARCALVTGLPPHVTGCVDNQPMPQDRPSLMERLRELGYQTRGVGKMHFTPDARRLWGFESRDVSEEMPPDTDDYRQFLNAHGFQHVDEPHGVRSEFYYIPQPSQLPARLHNTTWVADRSIEFLKRRDRRRPFFLWSSFIKPHPPFESPTPWNKLYRCAEMPAPFRPDGFERLLNYWNHHQNRYKYRDGGYDRQLHRTIRAAYYGCISFIDFQIGRILDALGAQADNTLIVFTSDHGELLGDYGSFGKRCMLDAAAKVPLLVRWPKAFRAGAQCAAPATLLDLWPTFLGAAGANEPQVCADGVDLRRLAKHPGLREDVISQFQDGRHGLYMIADRRWKYIYCTPDQREWLLDLQRDPCETKLVRSPHLARLRTRLLQRLQRNGWERFPKMKVPADPDAGLLFQDPRGQRERIAALGAYAPRKHR